MAGSVLRTAEALGTLGLAPGRHPLLRESSPHPAVMLQVGATQPPGWELTYDDVDALDWGVYVRTFAPGTSGGEPRYLLSQKQSMYPEIMLWRVIRLAHERLRCSLEDIWIIGGSHGTRKLGICPGCDASLLVGAAGASGHKDDKLFAIETDMIRLAPGVRFLDLGRQLYFQQGREKALWAVRLARATTELGALEEPAAASTGCCSCSWPFGSGRKGRAVHVTEPLDPRGDCGGACASSSGHGKDEGGSSPPTIPSVRRSLVHLRLAMEQSGHSALQAVMTDALSKARCVIMTLCGGDAGLCEMAQPKLEGFVPEVGKRELSIARPPRVAVSCWFEWRSAEDSTDSEAMKQPPFQMVALHPEALPSDGVSLAFVSVYERVSAARFLVSVRRSLAGRVYTALQFSSRRLASRPVKVFVPDHLLSEFTEFELRKRFGIPLSISDILPLARLRGYFERFLRNEDAFDVAYIGSAEDLEAAITALSGDRWRRVRPSEKAGELLATP
jgi:hypothetical protein